MTCVWAGSGGRAADAERSDRYRVSRGADAEIGIEGGGDGADERPALVRNLEQTLGKLDHAVGIGLRQILRIVEHGFGRAAELVPDGGEIESEIAHQQFDDPGADAVVFGEFEAAAAIEAAVEKAVTSGTRTGDIAFGHESVGTKEMAAAVLANL